MDLEVTKNKKRKTQIRQLAEVQGVGVARAGLINDRERKILSVDSGATSGEFIVVLRGTLPGATFDTDDIDLVPQARPGQLSMISDFSGSAVSDVDLMEAISEWNPLSPFPFQIAEVLSDDQDHVEVTRIRDDLDGVLIKQLGPDAGWVAKALNWVRWIEGAGNNTELDRRYGKLIDELFSGDDSADKAQDALLMRLQATRDSGERIEDGWESIASCQTNNEVAALVGRHLIDESSDWNQAAYDLLTTPYRKVFGRLHPDDVDMGNVPSLGFKPPRV